MVGLTYGTREFWQYRLRAQDGLRYLPWGLAAAESRAGTSGEPQDRMRVAHLALAYGSILINTGELAGAENTLQRSLRDFRAVQDQQGESEALSALSGVAMIRGRFEETVAYAQPALAIARATQAQIAATRKCTR